MINFHYFPRISSGLGWKEEPEQILINSDHIVSIKTEGKFVGILTSPGISYEIEKTSETQQILKELIKK